MGRRVDSVRAARVRAVPARASEASVRAARGNAGGGAGPVRARLTCAWFPGGAVWSRCGAEAAAEAVRGGGWDRKGPAGWGNPGDASTAANEGERGTQRAAGLKPVGGFLVIVSRLSSPSLFQPDIYVVSPPPLCLPGSKHTGNDGFFQRPPVTVRPFRVLPCQSRSRSSVRFLDEALKTSHLGRRDHCHCRSAQVPPFLLVRGSAPPCRRWPRRW